MNKDGGKKCSHRARLHEGDGTTGNRIQVAALPHTHRPRLPFILSQLGKKFNQTPLICHEFQKKLIEHDVPTDKWQTRALLTVYS